MREIILIAALAGLLAAFSTSVRAAAPTRQISLDPVAKLSTVTVRDARGRAQRFTDTGNREFAVKYDARDRIQSIEATRGPYISDVISIGYSDEGKLVGVQLRSGYMLFVDTQVDGTQVIRDSKGGVLRCGVRAISRAGAEDARSEQIVAAVSALESLLGALGRPVR